MQSNQIELPSNPWEKANLFSRLTFWWTINIFKRGHRKSFHFGDLFRVRKTDSSNALGDNLARCWIKQTKVGTPSLLKTIGLAFRVELIQLGLLHFSTQIMKWVAVPFFLGQFLLHFREGSDVSYGSAVKNAIGLLFSIGYGVTMGNQFQATAQRLGMRIRVAVCSLIYRKTLRLSQSSVSGTNPGQIINLISNDVTRLEYVPLTMNSLWISPLNSIIIIYFLWCEAGMATIVGITLQLLNAPAQSYFGKLVAKYRYEISIKTDERVKLMEEIIAGCHVIKMYAWEKPFAKLIETVRKLELKSVRNANLLRLNYLGIVIFTFRFSTFTTVVTLVLMKDSITASKIFSVLAFYMALSMQITRYFYHAYSDVSETWTVMKRLQTFLEYDEIQVGGQKKFLEFEKTVSHGSENDHEKIAPLLISKISNPQPELPKNVIISINNGMAQWNLMDRTKPETAPFSLKNINIDFKKGMFIGIIGPTGSGKTSLLQTILRELPLVDGSLTVGGTLSYASQEPWIFSGSVRQNILFGQEMDQFHYDRTVKACALQPDFKQFAQGDNSLVGDKGAALSGGQKARVNLARAIYRATDVYLLDDPLSAVDAHVGRYLLNSVIGPHSILAKAKSTRILVTHQVHFLSEADWIIALKDGTIEFQGTVQDLSLSKLKITELLNSNEIDYNSTLGSQDSLNAENVIDEPTEETPLQQNTEQSSKGKVDGSLLVNFIKCGATPVHILLFVVFYVSASTCASSIDFWLSHFISREELRALLNTKNQTFEINIENVNLWSSIDYLIVYATLILSFVVALIVRSIVASSTMANLSKGLHDVIFTGLMSSPIRFFEINPSGRILNRFSKDLGNVDEILARTLFDFAQTALNIPLLCLVISITYPMFALPMTLMFIAFIYLTRYTLKTSNDIKRVENITRSPVFSHMASSITGLSTIRACMTEQILIQEFDSHQDIHSGAYFLYIYASTAFAFALEMMSFLTILIMIVTILHINSQNLPGNKIGLILTQSLALQELLFLSAKQFALMCNLMMGVERLLEYKNLPPEQQPEIPAQISNKWPSHGKLEFRNVNYRYFNEADPVLNDLNFIIKSGEKIGIVGRTGAGKSSLIGALFRLAQLEGNIFIDDIDTGTIQLNELRKRISIIPQDPVLFSGTLRRNLDPFEEFEDAQLWQALKDVELEDVIISGPGLETVVLTGGNNFSVGQRQLLCLARAILRSNTILILDEATANIDPETDVLIQRTIREKFVNCTVLTVAHRLNTVIDSDRILVMQSGKIEEFATPLELLNKHDGIFKEMIEATGQNESKRLKILIYNQHSSNEISNIKL